MRSDTTKVQRFGDYRAAEREKCLGSNELWHKVKQNGPRTNLLGKGVLREYCGLGRADHS